MSELRKLLNHALTSIRKAKLQHPEAFALVQGSTMRFEDECHTFSNSIQFLESAVKVVDKYQPSFCWSHSSPFSQPTS